MQACCVHAGQAFKMTAMYAGQSQGIQWAEPRYMAVVGVLTYAPITHPASATFFSPGKGQSLVCLVSVSVDQRPLTSTDGVESDQLHCSNWHRACGLCLPKCFGLKSLSMPFHLFSSFLLM